MKIISILNVPHPGRGLKLTVLAVASRASAASLGETTRTFALETWPSFYGNRDLALHFQFLPLFTVFLRRLGLVHYFGRFSTCLLIALSICGQCTEVSKKELNRQEQ